MWTTQDGYTLRLQSDNPGTARALLHQAGLHQMVRAFYKGDLRDAIFRTLGSLATNAGRSGSIPPSASPGPGGGYYSFITYVGTTPYIITARRAGTYDYIISDISRQPRNLRPRTYTEPEALYMATGRSRVPSDRTNSPGDPVVGDYIETTGTGLRSERSERARYRDQLAGSQGHHAFPQYLGGQYRQTLLNLPNDLHYLYHQELDRILNLPRLRGKKAYQQLSSAQMLGVLKRLLRHARQFDARCSTQIAPNLRRGIRQARPLRGRK